MFFRLEAMLELGGDVEMLAGIAHFLVKVHESAILVDLVGKAEWRVRIERVKALVIGRLKEQKDLVGRNAAAVKYIAMGLKERRAVVEE